MLSRNPNRLHLPVNHHQPTKLFPKTKKTITHLLGLILLLGTLAEKGLLINKYNAYFNMNQHI